MRQSDCYTEGQRAFAAGKPASVNPYPKEADDRFNFTRRSWHRGWSDAKSAADYDAWASKQE